MNWYKKAQTDLPQDFDCSKLRNCMEAAEIVMKNLLLKAIKDFYIVEGWINFNNNEETETTHTWIELSNGDIIDPTKEQFKTWGYDPNEIIYSRIKKKYTPQEYMELAKRYPN